MKPRKDWFRSCKAESYLYILRGHLFDRDKRTLLSGAISVCQVELSLYIFGVNSAIPISLVKIPARYLNPESRDDFVANPASRRYLNPESRDNFGANPVSRNQKRPYPASRETPSWAP